MSFANLKKSRKSTSVDSLVEKAKEMSGGKKSYADDRFWKPTVDDNGNGYAIIRFLPLQAEGELPWVRYWDHFFKGPTGQFYIEKSLTTLGQTDPIGEENTRLWAIAETNGDDKLKNVVRNRKRKLHYVTNIYVVADPSNPESVGKVFLYDFGSKIMEKVMESMQPKFPGQDPVVPYDMWDGADLEMKIQNNSGGWRDYSASNFKPAAPLLGGDDKKLEKVYDELYAIGEFIDPANYKSYDALKTRLQAVLGQAVGENAAQQNEDLTKTADPIEPKTEAAPAIADASEDLDDGDALAYFTDMANGAT